MNTKIDIICTGLRDFAQSLKAEAKHDIANILPKQGSVVPPSRTPGSKSNNHVSNPERPWMLAGGAALVIGAIGAISSGGTWSYVLGSAGIASIIYGQTKKNGHEISVNARPVDSTPEPKSYEVAEKVIEIAKSTEAKWRDKVEDCKSSVQRIIESSSVSADEKDSLLSQTYTTERISIEFGTYLTRLESASVSSFPLILADYEAYVGSLIEKVAKDQIAIYNSISAKL
ncbi:MAG: hypothetical protein HDR93_04655 [Bacteroides sp.]|nr:hypothetical protein [Bacteroides sp.]